MEGLRRAEDNGVTESDESLCGGEGKDDASTGRAGEARGVGFTENLDEDHGVDVGVT